MTSLLMIGCGQMGRALLEPWLKAELFSSVDVIEPYQDGLRDLKMNLFADLAGYQKTNAKAPDIVMLAVKPQAMKEVLVAYQSVFSADSLIVTIAAGLRMEFYLKSLGDQTKLVRIMPNLAAFVGQGMSVGVATNNVPDDQKNLVAAMLNAVGKFVWLDNEKQLDAATLISGSGPAYPFLLTEILTRTAIEVGLSSDVAELLARQTMVGGGALLAARAEPAAQLRQNVMSPGGVTEAAMDVLLKDNLLQERFDDAIRQGIARGDELAKNQ